MSDVGCIWTIPIEAGSGAGAPEDVTTVAVDAVDFGHVAPHLILEFAFADEWPAVGGWSFGSVLGRADVPAS